MKQTGPKDYISQKVFIGIHIFPFENTLHLLFFSLKKPNWLQIGGRPPPPFTDLSATIGFFYAFPKLFFHNKHCVEYKIVHEFKKYLKVRNITGLHALTTFRVEAPL